jgi:hypothetical protein
VPHLTDQDVREDELALQTPPAPGREEHRERLNRWSISRPRTPILRKRIDKRLYLDPEEKRLLVKLGLAVGNGITALLTAVSYPAFRRWVGIFAPESAGPSARSTSTTCAGNALSTTTPSGPHQARDNALLIALSSSPRTNGKVVCRERLGGVLRHYYREAA